MYWDAPMTLPYLQYSDCQEAFDSEWLDYGRSYEPFLRWPHEQLNNLIVICSCLVSVYCPRLFIFTTRIPRIDGVYTYIKLKS